MATEARRGWVGGDAITRGEMREIRRSACERWAKMAVLLLTLDEAIVGGEYERGLVVKVRFQGRSCDGLVELRMALVADEGSEVRTTVIPSRPAVGTRLKSMAAT